MTARGRVLAIRLKQKLKGNADFAARMGIEVDIKKTGEKNE